MYVGGTLNFGSNDSNTKVGSATAVKGPSTTSFTGSPEFGYFVAENLSVGIALDLTSRNSTTYSAADGKEVAKSATTGVGATLYARKFFNITEELSLFGGVNVGFGSGDQKTTIIDPSSTIDGDVTSNFGASLDAGVAFSESNGGWQMGCFRLQQHNNN
jgi:hypothetical protein